MEHRPKKRAFRKAIVALGLGSVLIPAFLLFAGTASATVCPPKVSFDLKTFKPCFAVPIPTVKLSNITTTTTTLAGGEKTDAIDVPWIANYIGGVYEYAVSLGVLLAGVMVVIGGFQYVTAGGDAGRVGAAKERITNAIVGMLLVFAAYIILNTVNTELVKPKSIVVSTIKGQPWFIKQVEPKTYEKLTGKPPAARSAVMAMVAEAAKAQNLEPCIATEIVKGESGGSTTAIGHDENFLGTGVGSRIKFFKLGTKYSGAALGCSGERNSSCVNDDQKDADPMLPPDFGLDPRFTHGIGITQLTVGAARNGIRCPDGKMGIPWDAGNCSSVPDLLDPQKSIEASIKYLMKPQLAQCGGNPQCLFYRYAGKGCSARMSACIKMKYYGSCSGKGSSEIGNCFDWTSPYTPKKDDSPSEASRKRKCCQSVKWNDTSPPDPATCGG